MVLPVAAVATGSSKLPGMESAIDMALRQNPDVLLAESNVRAAQAELNATRLRISRDLTGAYAERREQQQRLEQVRLKLERLEALIKNSIASTEARTEVMIELAAADGALASIDARIRYLIGEGSDRALLLNASQSKTKGREMARRNFDEKHLGLLETKVSLDVQEAPLTDVLKALSALTGNVRFVWDRQFARALEELTTLSVKDVTLREALLMLSDTYSIAFLERDYGFRVVTVAEARRIQAAGVPEDLPVESRQ